MDAIVQHGVLFDLDGVLIDSESQYTEFWRGVEKIYPTGIPNFAVAIKGTTLSSILSHYKDPAIKADVIRRIHEHETEMVYGLYAGALEFLDALKDSGIPIAMVTSSDDVKMSYLKEQHPELLMRFNTIIDATKVTRSKPDPQGYLLGAEALGCRPGDCFVFEDSLQGLEAGRAAGAIVVGVATTYPEERIKALCDVVIPEIGYISVERLLSIVRK